MAFALTKFQAYGQDVSEPVQKRTLQLFECTITATAADVALDLGDVAGTAWSAIDNTAVGLAAKVAFTDILQRVQCLMLASCSEIDNVYLPAWGDATPASGYVGRVNNTAKTAPSWVFAAGEGALSYNIVFEWTLKPELRAVRADGTI